MPPNGPIKRETNHWEADFSTLLLTCRVLLFLIFDQIHSVPGDLIGQFAIRSFKGYARRMPLPGGSRASGIRVVVARALPRTALQNRLAAPELRDDRIPPFSIFGDRA